MDWGAKPSTVEPAERPSLEARAVCEYRTEPESLNCAKVRVGLAGAAERLGGSGLGGKLKDLVETSVIVPSDDIAAVEDVHMVIDHVITTILSRM